MKCKLLMQLEESKNKFRKIGVVLWGRGGGGLCKCSSIVVLPNRIGIS